jgi:hypothetical protein
LWRLGHNPRLEMEFERPDGRVMFIELEEFRHLVAAADLLGRPSIGDSQYLGLFGGRRQTDRLALADEGLVDGRRRLRQSKTGKLIPIKDAPQLAARLDQARARVGRIKLRLGTQPDTIVVDETTGRAYNDTTYRHWFSECRRGAVQGIVRVDGRAAIADPSSSAVRDGSAQYLLTPMPSCADKRDQDLRDTCVILLFRAGVDAPGICDITGHSCSSVETIRKHYLGANNLGRADAAIDKLVAWIGTAV